MRYTLIFLLLAGCATPEQKAERMISRYGPLCERLGYTKESEGWRNCILQQQQQFQSQRGTACNTVGSTTICN